MSKIWTNWSNIYGDGAAAGFPEQQFWAHVIRQAIWDGDFRFFESDMAAEIIDLLGLDYGAFIERLNKQLEIDGARTIRKSSRRFM